MTETQPDGDGSDFIAELLRENKDLIPSPYGQHAALEQSGSVATPLLAGFALTMATLVLTSPGTFRWANSVLLLLTVAVVSLIMSMQSAQSSRAYLVRPDEIAAWWPHMTTLQRNDRILEAISHDRSRNRWSIIQRCTYRAGVLALLGGFALALVPPQPGKGDDPISWVRWAAVIAALLGFLAELVWTSRNAVADYRGWRQTKAADHRR